MLSDIWYTVAALPDLWFCLGIFLGYMIYRRK